MHTAPTLTENHHVAQRVAAGAQGPPSPRSPWVRPVALTKDDPLVDFCADVFASLARSDQRRCAESYVRGLIHGTGRRSTRRIAAELAGPQSDQALQQFVNQSPWDPAPVRLRIAELVAELAGPAAWRLEEVAFNKNGRCSAGVERQFVPSLGKVANAQLAATLTLTSAELSAPVDWRLCLPQSWDQDERRRRGAHVPEHERHQPYWQYLVDLVDELTVDFGLSAAPITADLAGSAQGGELVGALHDRGLGCLVRIGARQPVHVGRRPGGQQFTTTITEVALQAARAERRTVTWRSGPDARMPRSQFITLPVLIDQPGGGRQRPLRALVEWPLGRAQPTSFWLSTLLSWPIEDLVALAKLDWRPRQTMHELTTGFGLCDYEGRSFLGWHHHVTLASAAYIFQLQQAFEQRRRREAGDLAVLPEVRSAAG